MTYEVNLSVPAFSISMQYIHVCTKITGNLNFFVRNVLNDRFWCSDLQAVADIIRTTLGPRAMLKMLLDAGGGIILSHAFTINISKILFYLCCSIGTKE